MGYRRLWHRVVLSYRPARRCSRGAGTTTLCPGRRYTTGTKNLTSGYCYVDDTVILLLRSTSAPEYGLFWTAYLQFHHMYLYLLHHMALLKLSPNSSKFKEPRNRFQGIDSKESILPAHVAWRASAIPYLSYRSTRNRFLEIDYWAP